MILIYQAVAICEYILFRFSNLLRERGRKTLTNAGRTFIIKKKAVKGITGAEPTERENRPRLKGGFCLGGGGLPGAPS